MIDTLLDLGADINIQDNEKNSALHLGVYTSDTHLIKKLIIRGCNKNLKNINDLKAYDLAVNMSKLDIAEILKAKSFKEKFCFFKDELGELKRKRYDIVLLSFLGCITMLVLCFYITTMKAIFGEIPEKENRMPEMKDLFRCADTKCVFETTVTTIVLVFDVLVYAKLIINIYFHCNKIYERKGSPTTSLIVY
jgi:hypothetical protein